MYFSEYSFICHLWHLWLLCCIFKNEQVTVSAKIQLIVRWDLSWIGLYIYSWQYLGPSEGWVRTCCQRGAAGRVRCGGGSEWKRRVEEGRGSFKRVSQPGGAEEPTVGDEVVVWKRVVWERRARGKGTEGRGTNARLHGPPQIDSGLNKFGDTSDFRVFKKRPRVTSGTLSRGWIARASKWIVICNVTGENGSQRPEDGHRGVDEPVRETA